MERLGVSENKKYLLCGNKPFFWLGDTAWLLFHKLNCEEAYIYLKNRVEKGFNVIQAVLVYATEELNDVNKMYIPNCNVNSLEYWEYCDKIIKMAENLGLYMALLPNWGSLIKKGVITEANVEKYANFLADRYKEYTNIIWVLGGDVKPEGFENIYNIFGSILKRKNPDKLITYHPFGRCRSAQWFNNAGWLDFNMFQSGHRRYDQSSLGKWDDNKKTEGFFGEDNWRYVLKDRRTIPIKPTLDGEPSYEWILQGLHDTSQPYWVARDVRRYAYWSVFAGACGHTYGDNAIMQFYMGETESKSKTVNYGVKCVWQEALHHEGSGQMKYLAELINSVDFVNGEMRDDLIIGGQLEKYDRIAVFAGKDFVFAYTYSGNEFQLLLDDYGEMEAWWMIPSKGIYSYIGKINAKIYSAKPPKAYDDDTDRVLVLKK